MSVSVEQIARNIVAREGGFVNDPSDPGGATKYGVTLGTMRRLGLDENNDGRINVTDVKLLTMQDAINIFIKDYFQKTNIKLLPDILQPSVFDMYVNAGSNSVKILQRLLKDFQHPIQVDGALGPATAKAVEQVYKSAGEYLYDAYGIARRNYYFRLADHRPSLRKYARTRAGGKGGWIKRAEEFMEPKYRLTNAEFQERVKAW